MKVIDNITGFPPRQNSPRVNQQSMLANAVTSHVLGGIISGNPESLKAGSGVSFTDSGLTSIPNGESRTITTTLSDNFGRVLLAMPDEAIYINGTAAANQWPNATFNMTNVKVSFWNDWGYTNNINVVRRVSLVNNSGGAITVTYIYRWRIITNPIGGQTGANG